MAIGEEVAEYLQPIYMDNRGGGNRISLGLGRIPRLSVVGGFNRIIDRPSLLGAGYNVIFAGIIDFNPQLLFENIPGTGRTFLLKYRQSH